MNTLDLALADLGAKELRDLIAGGELLLLEFKQSLPKRGLGDTVASLANTLGQVGSARYQG